MDYRLSARLRDETNKLDRGLLQTVTVTASGPHIQSGCVEVGTTEETITIASDIGTVGLCWFENRGSTNNIKIGIATGSYFLEIKPGEGFPVRLPPAIGTLFVIALTAAEDLYYFIGED